MRMQERILSQPIDIYWLGWWSNTRELGLNGWDISANEMPDRNSIQIVLRQPEHGIYGMSDSPRYEYRSHWNSHYYRGLDKLDKLIFRMTLAHNVHVHTMESPIDLWKPVDPVPSVAEIEHRLEDLNVFRRLPPEEKDIILPPPSFDQIMLSALLGAPRPRPWPAPSNRHDMGAILRVAA